MEQSVVAHRRQRAVRKAPKHEGDFTLPIAGNYYCHLDIVRLFFSRAGQTVHQKLSPRIVAHCRGWQKASSSGAFFASVAIALMCLTNVARACQISVTGVQGGISNSSPVDCISISNATVSGNINNTGSILLSGIALSNSSVSGELSNIGSLTGGNITSFAGGIFADDKTSIMGGAFGIGLIGVPAFSGGINNGATITAGTGIYVDFNNIFTGGINNNGRINAGDGISVSQISTFSGGVFNAGVLATTNYGISISEIQSFLGGIYNSGSITSTATNRAGVSLFDVTFAGGITNHGSIVATGTGMTGISLGDITCFCNSNVSFSGGILNNGTITGGDVGIYIAPLTFSGGVTNTGIISGNTGIILDYDGASIINSGTITGLGGTAIVLGGNGDTLMLTPTSIINGNVQGNGTEILQLGGSGAGVFDISTVGGSAQYRGFGTLEKIDNSIWTLIGAGAFTGPVNVDGGTLLVNGSLASATLTTVNPGGTLGGTGTVGNTLVNGGSLTPGNPVGTLTVQGNLVLTSASSYIIGVSSSNSGSVKVSGMATLGGNVSVISPNSSYSFNSPYTILTSAGLNGTQFNALTTPTGIAGSLIYSGSTVLLDLTSGLGEMPGLSANQRAVGTALDTAFNTTGLRTGAIDGIFGGNINQNLTQVSGELATGTQQTTFEAMNLFIGLLTDPFIGGRGYIPTPASRATPLAEESDPSNAYASTGNNAGTERDAYGMITKALPRNNLYDPHWSVWAAGFGGSQTTNGNAALGSNTAASNIYGTAVGADYRFSPDTLAGFALAGGGTSFSVANGLGSGRSDLFQAGAFMRHNAGPAYISAALAYGWQDITTDRTVTISGVDQLHAEFNANTYAGRVEGGYRYLTPWLGITPYAAGQFTTFDLPNYAESVLSGASAFALNYNAKDVTDTRSELGIRTDRSWAMQDAIFTLRGRVAWAHDFDPDRSIAATFQTLPGASFVVNGAAQAHDSALTTASAEIKWINGWSAAATFEGEFSDVTNSYAGKGVVRYAW
jgi:uncharacterized protein with beta-barrel porin domain